MLASASPRRRELLSRLCDEFVVAPTGVDESLPPGVSPDAAAVDIARRKAFAASQERAGAVLAADTIVVAADGEILGKPADDADARRMLRRLSGTTHRVVTGVVFIERRGGRVVSASESTNVTMRPISDAEIAAYVATGESQGKAGAYAIQETADRFVTRVEGSWTNVVGLPLEVVERMLRSAGVPTRSWT